MGTIPNALPWYSLLWVKAQQIQEEIFCMNSSIKRDEMFFSLLVQVGKNEFHRTPVTSSNNAIPTIYCFWYLNYPLYLLPDGQILNQKEHFLCIFFTPIFTKLRLIERDKLFSHKTLLKSSKCLIMCLMVKNGQHNLNCMVACHLLTTVSVILLFSMKIEQASYNCFPRPSMPRHSTLSLQNVQRQLKWLFRLSKKKKSKIVKIPQVYDDSLQAPIFYQVFFLLKTL